jgi:hypothetical protein
MRNWQDNSNELTRQQYKNNQVHQQQEARRTVAEGFQTDLDVYKNTIKSNPDRAKELGNKLYSFDNLPSGMSKSAYRSVLIEEGLTAIQGHDYSALKLMNDSGIVDSFDNKTLKRYQQAQGIIDTDNFDMSEAARLSYETSIENPNATAQDITTARQQFDSTRIQVQARNTGTAKHIKTTFGSDRWRGVLGKQYADQLQADIEAGNVAKLDGVQLNDSAFQMELYAADPTQRRKILADRLDDVFTASHDPTLTPDVRKDLNDQFKRGTKQLETWQAADEAQRKKDGALIVKKEQEEKDLKEGVTSLVTGK